MANRLLQGLPARQATARNLYSASTKLFAVHVIDLCVSSREELLTWQALQLAPFLISCYDSAAGIAAGSGTR